MKNTLLATLSMLLFGCTGMPAQVTPVTGFELERYLGTWYEIARLDHYFERGLTRVTASYSLREDDGIRVLNRGYDRSSGEWKEAEGKAYFVDSPEVGRLKVSFFGPFYGGYNVIALDEQNYQYALVAGPSTSYLWILARQPELDPSIVDRLVNQARSRGFDTEALIWVNHESDPSA
jgi:apolipoprotein D and lipocalin family protein